MHITVYSTRPYDRAALSTAAQGTPHLWTFLDVRLDATTEATAQPGPTRCVCL